jgi:hypothetical protein
VARSKGSPKFLFAGNTATGGQPDSFCGKKVYAAAATGAVRRPLLTRRVSKAAAKFLLLPSGSWMFGTTAPTDFNDNAPFKQVIIDLLSI